MAIIYWRLGHLTAKGFQRPLDAFLIFRDGLVFDVDSYGWDLGIRPGNNLAEMKWRYPAATWVPWQPGYYHQLLVDLQEWLGQHAAAYQQIDPREGWWEWPRLTQADWRRLADAIVPRWAQRIEAGVASHPWLAHWVAEEGAQLNLPHWASSFWKTYILSPKKEEGFWPRLPLRFVEGISEQTRQQWHRQRWEKVQDVPGLLSRIRSHHLWTESRMPSHKVLARRFDGPVSAGVGDILADMAVELHALCGEYGQGVKFLRVTWFRSSGMERREREWSTAAGDGKTVAARVLSLLNHPPSHPFDAVQLEVRLESLSPEQLAWWNLPQGRANPDGIPGLMRFSVSRRELLLQHWDLWRMAGTR